MRVVTLFLGAFMVMCCLGSRTDGPIQPSDRVTVALRAGDEAVTWGMPVSAPVRIVYSYGGAENSVAEPWELEVRPR